MSLARIQQLAVLAIVLATVAWAGWFLPLGEPWLAALALPLIALGYVGVIGAEFLLLRRSFAADDPLRPMWLELGRAWLREIRLTPRVFLWRQPFRSQVEPDHLPSDVRGRRGVVLVHGFFCNRGLWLPWMRRLRRAGVPFVAVDLEPVGASIDRYAEIVGRAVERLWSATGKAPVGVGHSMGGLALRAWQGRAFNESMRLHHLITVATPHEGTSLARLGRLSNVREMRAGGEWLRSAPMTSSTRDPGRFTCFWSHCDNIVFPSRNATLAGADNRHLPVTPHVQMVYHPAVFAAVLEQLEVDEARMHRHRSPDATSPRPTS